MRVTLSSTDQKQGDDMEGRGTEGRIHHIFGSRLHRLWVFKSRVLIYVYKKEMENIA
jgi:hypothetical protein